MQDPLIHQAIQLALAQNWKEAIRLNQNLLAQNAEDIDALNRLAYAYLKVGNLPFSKTTYKKVLKIDKYNPIALKNLKWLSTLSKKDIDQELTFSPAPSVFLEEPGKTKIVTLVHPAPIRILANLSSAQQVFLLPKKHSIEVRTAKEVYVGALPDDLSHRLLRFITAGNTYEAYIKNVTKNSVIIFIREIKRGKKFTLIPSFAVYKDLPANKHSGLLRKEPQKDLEEGEETPVSEEEEE